MRASDLLYARVVGPDGRPLGVVTGLRCSLDGPSAGRLRAPRLQTLVVNPRRAGTLLGYEKERKQGPWLVRRVVELLHRGSRFVEWDAVAEVGDGVVRLRQT
jgi:hypothetical protein